MRLEELTLLVGRNGVGKTATLDVIHALRSLLEGTPRVTDRDIFPTSSLTRWQTRDTQVFEMEVELGEDTFVYRLEVEHDRAARRARIVRETLTGSGGPLFGFEMGEVQLYRDDHSEGPSFGSDWTQSGLARVVPTSENVKLTCFLGFMTCIVVCGPNPPLFAHEAVTEESVLSRNGDNFVSWYRHLVQEWQNRSSRHEQEMNAVLDGLQGFRLKKVGADARTLVGVFGDALEGPQLRFDEWSDGQRALTLLYTLSTFVSPEGYVLMIDEPVNYVALREIQPWLMTLSDACGDAFPQAVLCSHHPEVIDYLGRIAVYCCRETLWVRQERSHCRKAWGS